MKGLGVILVETLSETLFDKVAEVKIELRGVKLMNVEAETISSTLLKKFKKIDLELLFLKLFEVNAETIGYAIVDRLPEIEVDGTASNGKMETSRDLERHYLPNYLA